MSQTKSKLFGNFDVNNKPHRSGFDLSRRNLFSAKVGELLPVFCENVLPGDHWKLSSASFTRTQPVESAAFTRLLEYVDFFFVPYRLLWRNAHASFTQMSDAKNVALSPTSTQNINDKVPYISVHSLLTYISTVQDSNAGTPLKSEVGSDYVQDVLKLLTYLGYGDFLRLYKQNNGVVSNIIDTIDNYNVSLLPLLAYQKIYFDFYRNSQWEVNQANAYNVDYMSATSTNISDYLGVSSIDSTGIFNLRYANFAKDILIGLLPSAQYGDAASIRTNSTGSLSIARNAINLGEVGLQSSGKEVKIVSVDNQQYGIVGSKNAAVDDPVSTLEIKNNDPISASISQIDMALSALDIRNLMATQKWREVANSGDRTYRDQVKKHFGVELPAVLDNNCTYISGWKGTITINEVVNQNLSEANQQTDIKGKGVGSFNGNNFEFDVKEHGIILGIYHSAPMVDYSFTAPSRQLQTINIADFFIPEYDKLGFEEVKSSDFFDTKLAQLNSPITLGFAPRYWMYKTATDQVNGIFRTSLPQWVAPFDQRYFYAALSRPLNQLPKLTYKFFKVNPSILDDIFGVQAFSGTNQIDNDQLLISLDMSVFATRNMDFSGIPY